MANGVDGLHSGPHAVRSLGLVVRSESIIVSTSFYHKVAVMELHGRKLAVYCNAFGPFGFTSSRHLHVAAFAIVGADAFLGPPRPNIYITHVYCKL